MIVSALATEYSIQSFPILEESENFNEAKERFIRTCKRKAPNRVILGSKFEEETKNDCRTEHILECKRGHKTRKQLRQQRLEELNRKRLETPNEKYRGLEEDDEGLNDWKPPIESMKGWDMNHLLHKILLLYEFIKELKIKFNEKLNHLGQEKEIVVRFLIECKRRIREITDKIGNPFPEEYFSKLSIDLQKEENGTATNFESYVMNQKKWFINHGSVENLWGIDKEQVMRHYALLRHELDQLLRDAKERVSSFDTSMQQLKVDEENLLIELNVQEIRLIAFLEQLSILIQTESKEKLLDASYRKATDVLEEVGRLHLEKQKQFHETNTKLDVMKDRESDRDKLLQSILSKCILHHKVLQEMYYSDAEDHLFPSTCPTKYYDSVSNLRKSRQSQERRIRELKNDLDTMHHDLKLLAEDEERSNIEAMTARELLDSFLKDKVNMLSKIKSTFVVRDGDLSDICTNLNNLMVCSRSSFENLKQKENDFRSIISKEKSKLKSLQIQRNELKKETAIREERVNKLYQDCNYTQQLKLGQVLEMDALYSFLDSIDTDENSFILNDSQTLEDDNKIEILQAEKRLAELKTKLKDIMRTNTSLLQQVGTFKEKQRMYMYEKEKTAKQVRIPQHMQDKEIQELRKTADTNSTKIQELRSAIERFQRKTCSIYDYSEVSTCSKHS